MDPDLKCHNLPEVDEFCFVNSRGRILVGYMECACEVNPKASSSQFSADEDLIFASPVQLGALHWSYPWLWRLFQKAAAAAQVGKLGATQNHYRGARAIPGRPSEAVPLEFDRFTAAPSDADRNFTPFLRSGDRTPLLRAAPSEGTTGGGGALAPSKGEQACARAGRLKVR